MCSITLVTSMENVNLPITSNEKKLTRFFLGLALCALFFSASAQSDIDTIVYDGLNRLYEFHVPASYDGSEEIPLVFNMHGRGSNSYQQRIYSQMDGVANLNNFIVVYPNAEFINNIRQWNLSYNVSPPGVFPVIPDDVGFVDSLIDFFIANYAIDTNRIYTCGMSAGGFVSYFLSCAIGERFAAMASVTGLPPFSIVDSCPSARTVPVMQVHGTADTTVEYFPFPGYIGVEGAVDFIRDRNGCDIQADYRDYGDIDNDGVTAERFIYPNCRDNGELWFYKLTNATHTWPGTPIAFPGDGISYEIDGSAEIWRFFECFSKDPSFVCVPTDLSSIDASFQAFPNPTSEHVFVPRLLQGSTYQVYSQDGRLMLESSAPQGYLEVAELPEGMYYVSGEGYTFRLSIQH